MRVLNSPQPDIPAAAWWKFGGGALAVGGAREERSTMAAAGSRGGERLVQPMRRRGIWNRAIYRYLSRRIDCLLTWKTKSRFVLVQKLFSICNYLGFNSLIEPADLTVYKFDIL